MNNKEIVKDMWLEDFIKLMGNVYKQNINSLVDQVGGDMLKIVLTNLFEHEAIKFAHQLAAKLDEIREKGENNEC